VQGPGARDADGFRHAALLYQTPAEFTAGVLPFVEAGVAASEAVMVASHGRNLQLLRAKLDGLGEWVAFADLARIGPNPGRLLGWMRQVTEQYAGQPVRYVHEAIWPSRRLEEVREVIRHEALINRIVSSWRVSILCPYDPSLSPDVIASAERTHPAVIRSGHRQASSAYDSGVLVPAECDRPLEDPPARAAVLTYRDDLAPVRAFTAEHAHRAGLPDHLAGDLVIAVGELTANTLAHTGRPGSLAIWATPHEVVCQVDDHGHIENPLTGRLRPAVPDTGGWGLWAVNQLCDLVEIRTGCRGTQIRLHMRRPA
jgi:anti-sigma regulatory factor (Ser/Thr protein kinase)